MSTTNSRTTTHDRPVPDVDEPAPEYEKLYKTTGNRRQRRRRRFPPEQCVPAGLKKILYAHDGPRNRGRHTIISKLLLFANIHIYILFKYMVIHIIFLT
jgi:hypothetical protein